tara:strand:- start:259 stop:414 length:156 start_codon:yes stop_codon:yes gene_type:complete
MSDSLNTYDELNEDIQFTEDETKALLKLSEKEILVLILSELKKQSGQMSEN